MEHKKKMWKYEIFIEKGNRKKEKKRNEMKNNEKKLRSEVYSLIEF